MPILNLYRHTQLFFQLIIIVVRGLLLRLPRLVIKLLPKSIGVQVVHAQVGRVLGFVAQVLLVEVIIMWSYFTSKIIFLQISGVVSGVV